MPEHIVADCLDVLRRDETTAIEKRLSLGGAEEEDRGARAGPILDVRPQIETVIAGPPCGVDDIDDVTLDRVGDVNRIETLPQFENVLRLQHRGDVQIRLDGGHAVEDVELLVL